MDEIVIFDRLSEDDLKKIVEIQLRHLAKRLEQQKIALSVSDSAKTLLAREGYYQSTARGHSSAQSSRLILDPLSIQILEGKIHEGQSILADQKNGVLEFKTR